MGGGHLYTFQGFLRSMYVIEIFWGVAKFQIIFLGMPDFWGAKQ